MATHSSILAWRIPWAQPDGGHEESDTTEVTEHSLSPSLRVPLTHLLLEFPLIRLLSEFPLTQLFSGIPHTLSHSTSLGISSLRIPAQSPLRIPSHPTSLRTHSLTFPRTLLLSDFPLGLLLPELPHILPSSEFAHSLTLPSEFLLTFLLSVFPLTLLLSEFPLTFLLSDFPLSFSQNSLTQTFSHLPSLRTPSHPPLLRIPLLRNPSLSSQNSFSPSFSQNSLTLSQNCLIPSISQNSLTASLAQNSSRCPRILSPVRAWLHTHTHTSL